MVDVALNSTNQPNSGGLGCTLGEQEQGGGRRGARCCEMEVREGLMRTPIVLRPITFPRGVDII